MWFYDKTCNSGLNDWVFMCFMFGMYDFIPIYMLFRLFAHQMNWYNALMRRLFVCSVGWRDVDGWCGAAVIND